MIKENLLIGLEQNQIMDVSNYTLKQMSSWTLNQPRAGQTAKQAAFPKFVPLLPLRQKLDSIKVNNPQLAHRLCKLIPAQCPFEKKITLRSRTLLHIPPLCKLNPVYDELVALRFRAICYLAEQGEDVSLYC